MEIVEFYPKREIGGYNIDTIRKAFGFSVTSKCGLFKGWCSVSAPAPNRASTISATPAARSSTRARPRGQVYLSGRYADRDADHQC